MGLVPPSTLELLLQSALPDLKKDMPSKKIEVKRLSKFVGNECIFELKALHYNTIESIHRDNSRDISIHILLAGVVSPSLKDNSLLAKYSAPTPADLVKSLLLPGEIEDIKREIELLSGYRQITISEIKNA